MRQISTVTVRQFIVYGVLALLLTACSESSDAPIPSSLDAPLEANDPVDDGRLRLVYFSEFSGFRNIGRIVSEADLVVIGRAGVAAKFGDLQYVTKLQTLEIEEVLLGQVPASEVGLVTYGANIDHEPIVQLFEQGGELVLPIGGFGGLLKDERYLLFLSKTQKDIKDAPDHKFEVAGTLSQGAFYIAPGGETRRFGLPDVLDPDGNLVMSTTFLSIEIEPVPELTGYTDGASLSDLKNLVVENQSQFQPAADPALNHFIEINYIDAGDVLEVTLTNGAPNNHVFVVICGADYLGPEACFVDDFQGVKLDRNGGAQVDISVSDRDMFQSVCQGPCYIVVSSRSELYASVQIE